MSYESEQQSKRCVDCLEIKPLTEFYRSKLNRGGLSTACKPCFRARNVRSFHNHLETRKAARRRYVEENAEKLRADARDRKRAKLIAMSPEELAEYRRKRAEGKKRHRAKKYGSGGRHTNEEWQRLLDLCGRRCLRCGKAEDLSQDHIKALTRGGSDAIDNIQPLCRPCNAWKSNRHDVDFRPPYVAEEVRQWSASATPAAASSGKRKGRPLRFE
jgi:5-methylcytosine-specific restriction endonuclease McrA